MFFDWFQGLGVFDKITVIIFGSLLIVFILTICICRVKYELEREELGEYWKECNRDKNFEDMDNKKD